MAQNRVFVFRTNYDDAHQYILDELSKGVLRQGWGVTGTSLLNTTGERINKSEWLVSFSKAWEKPFDEIESSKRYNILSRMLAIKKGDIVVIPKTRNSQTLSICKVSKEYWFDQNSSTMWNDFRHCIDVENVRSYAYDSCGEAKLVSSKFIAYQSAVNNVKATMFIENVSDLYKRENNYKSETIRQILLQIKSKSIEKIAPSLLDINPSSFEDIIAECLEKKGYIIAARRQCDGDGADADIVATYPLPFFTAFIEISPTILIQIKKKTGTDRDDKIGIDQLVKSKQNFENPICVLLHTSDHISDETEQYANKEGIKIINGNQLLEFILTSELF